MDRRFGTRFPRIRCAVSGLAAPNRMDIKTAQPPKDPQGHLSLINRWLDSPSGQLALLTTIAVIYTLAYLGHPTLPGNNLKYPLGWWGWWDQGQYLKCAASLAHLRITADTYWYPLGYPAIGALFYRLAPQHAFFLPDLIFVLGITALFYRIAKRLISPLEAVLIIVVFIVCYHGSLSATLVEPWNTTPTYFLSYAIIWLVALCKPNKQRVVIGAVCVGIIYLCRPTDALWMAFLLGVSIMGLSIPGDKLRAACAVFGILTCIVVSVLLVNHTVFGSCNRPTKK